MDLLQNILNDTEGKIAGSLALVLLLYSLRILLNRVINRKVDDLRKRYVWRQIINYVFLFAALVLLVRLWFAWFQSIFTLLSVIAAATVIVSKELILNYIGYGVIIWRGLFNVGDRIQIGQYAGDVMEIGPVYIAIAEIGNWVHGDDTTGRTLKLPNSMVLTQAVANYSHGFPVIWNELTLELQAASNLAKAKEIALKIARAYSYQFTAKDFQQIREVHEDIMFTRSEPAVYLGWKDGKITLTMRYACKFHKRRQTEQQIWDNLLEQLLSHDDIQLTVARN